MTGTHTRQSTPGKRRKRVGAGRRDAPARPWTAWTPGRGPCRLPRRTSDRPCHHRWAALGVPRAGAARAHVDVEGHTRQHTARGQKKYHPRHHVRVPPPPFGRGNNRDAGAALRGQHGFCTSVAGRGGEVVGGVGRGEKATRAGPPPPCPAGEGHEPDFSARPPSPAAPPAAPPALPLPRAASPPPHTANCILRRSEGPRACRHPQTPDQPPRHRSACQATTSTLRMWCRGGGWGGRGARGPPRTCHDVGAWQAGHGHSRRSGRKHTKKKNAPDARHRDGARRQSAAVGRAPSPPAHRPSRSSRHPVAARRDA